MASVALTFGDTVKSFPRLANSTSRKVQKAVRAILERTANEVVRNLKVPGRDYNDRTFNLRRSWRRRRSRGFKYRVFNNAEYASFIENGTYRIEARKMLHREIYNARARLRRRLRALDRKVERGLIR